MDCTYCQLNISYITERDLTRILDNSMHMTLYGSMKPETNKVSQLFIMSTVKAIRPAHVSIETRQNSSTNKSGWFIYCAQHKS
jgi:hypothetical protein